MYHKILFILFSLITVITNAQNITGGSSIKQIMATVDTFNSRLPSEQLYLHFDKPYYAVGDTIWFKAYLFETTTHAYSAISGLLYIELITDSNKVIKRLSVPVSFGISWAQIALNREEVVEGNYSIRAYTNWMQNFGEDYFFRQRFRITNAETQNWLVKEDHTITAEGEKENLAFTLQLSNTNKSPVKNNAVNFKIVSDNKTVFKKDVQTNAAGIIKEEFVLPANNKFSKSISIVLDDKNDRSVKAYIPLQINRPQDIDLQFMPEGGYLVAGIQSRVGVKAIVESGYGTDIRGKIVDSKNVTVASFQSIYKGMSVFEIVPVKGENYFAVVDRPGGNIKRYPLPAVKNSGIVIRVDNQDNDSLTFAIFCSQDLVGSGLYHLSIFCRGAFYYGAGFHFKTAEIYQSLSKNIFPSGIIHFTVMNPSGEPLNERMIFIDHADNLQIGAQTSNITFTPRDSIGLNIKVSNKNGTPVIGSFSLAVTDDAQVKTDTINADNIVSRLLLTGELKGNVESPGYYFSKNIKAQQALDALLLTQGWIGYNWKKIYKPPVPLFAAEKKLAVSGTVTNFFNKPVNKAQVILLSTGTAKLFTDTRTNEKGEFIFSDFPLFDSLAFFVQVRNTKGKNFGMGLSVNKFIPAEITQVLPPATPWYVNSDTAMLAYVQNNFARQFDYDKKYKVLSTVKVSSKKSIKGSKNLNGSGEADQVITETEVESAGKKTLLDLLKEKVKGFRISYGVNGDQQYWIYFDPVSFLVDGVYLNRFNSEMDSSEYTRVNFTMQTLQSLETNDITGIETMSSPKYTSYYKSAYLSLAQQMSITQYAFIEITTRSGNGAFMRKIPGVATYRPITLSMPKQFYSPRYTINNTHEKNVDMRSTIYWQPNVVTNALGEATVSFYAADTPGTYSIIIQGTDLNGSMGYKIKKITIK